MKLVIEAIVTQVQSGKNYDYVTMVDIENGGIFSVGVSKGSADGIPQLKPLQIVAEAKGGRYGLSLVAFKTNLKGGE